MEQWGSSTTPMASTPTMAVMAARRNSITTRGLDNDGFQNEPGLEPPLAKVKRVSRMEEQAHIEAVRTRCLTRLRELLATAGRHSGEVSHAQLTLLLKGQEFSNCLFPLFAPPGSSSISQEQWLAQMRASTPSWEGQTAARAELVDLLEAIAFLICREEDMTMECFNKIWGSHGVVSKLVKCLDKDQDGVCSTEECMAFLVAITSRVNTGALTKDNITWLEKVFRENLAPGQKEFTLKEFKKIVPSKNNFFVEGAFRIFDKDSSGTVSLEEFLETMHQFANQGEEEKLSFLFKVYDPNGDGQIDEGELKDIIISCVAENGMEFDEQQVCELAEALFQNAVKEGNQGITVDDLSEEFKKHPGLLENLTLSIGKWLVPPRPTAPKSWRQKLEEKLPQNLNMRYFSNNKPFFIFLILIVFINAVLFLQRLVYFRHFPMLSGFTPNPMYLLSRACGRTLLFNSVLVLVLVLRYSITILRNLGLASILPLDNNIYFHKLVGRIIFAQAWIHTIMHLINFGVNIQPDPVRFVQLSAPYWQDWTKLGYQTPEGCTLQNISEQNLSSSSNTSQLSGSSIDLSSFPCNSIPPTGLSIPVNITHCQVCVGDGEPWSYAQWLFTGQPGIFGTVGGAANPTGVGLILILTIMVGCSLSGVRRSGYFLVFYFSHLNYVLYFLLLLFHAPDFWKWFVAFGCIWGVELTYRAISAFLGRGATTIAEGIPLPSRVTCLKIRKPAKFHYSPGDWVFIKIPKIAAFEWHPFTISSAPEVQDTFSVHIRGVGQWTNKLYDHFKAEKADHGDDVVPELTGKPDGRLRSLDIFVDGPFGSPSSNIYRAEHAVLVGTGIGVTPFASILQSITQRYKQVKQKCPSCQHQWSDKLDSVMGSLKKVDFFWINRDQKSFEWFVNLLSQLEIEQAEIGGALSRFLEMHMYVTSALQRTDMKSVFLQMAMDLLHKKGSRDLVTGLKSRTNAGRPNWNKVFAKIREQKIGKITVFFCGNPTLGKMLKGKCDEFGFTFRKEVF